MQTLFKEKCIFTKSKHRSVLRLYIQTQMPTECTMRRLVYTWIRSLYLYYWSAKLWNDKRITIDGFWFITAVSEKCFFFGVLCIIYPLRPFLLICVTQGVQHNTKNRKRFSFSVIPVCVFYLLRFQFFSRFFYSSIFVVC